MKKIKEKEIRSLELFATFTALVTVVLCILFLINFLQNHWFLNFILGLGVLLHVALFLLALLKKRHISSGAALLLALAYVGALIYFNML